jgi:hypothetical protein
MQRPTPFINGAACDGNIAGNVCIIALLLIIPNTSRTPLFVPVGMKDRHVTSGSKLEWQCADTSCMVHLLCKIVEMNIA